MLTVNALIAPLYSLHTALISPYPGTLPARSPIQDTTKKRWKIGLEAPRALPSSGKAGAVAAAASLSGDRQRTFSLFPGIALTGAQRLPLVSTRTTSRQRVRGVA
jgi:hypothetical protein